MRGIAIKQSIKLLHTCCLCVLFFCVSAYALFSQSCDTIPPLVYCSTASDQFSFVGFPALKLQAKLIPNLEQREKQNVKTIDNIIGVTHFFLDHDLSSEFVHPYTTNFYNALRETDYVLKFDRIEEKLDMGYIYYVHKKELSSTDKLGSNVAFYRQWKLSEIDMIEKDGVVKIKMKKSIGKHSCISPQLREGIANPFKEEIPIRYYTSQVEGYQDLSNFNVLDKRNGATVVFIWEENGNIIFQDLHGSLEQIIHQAIFIRNTYHVDPTIAISDAGSLSGKIKSNENYILDCNGLKKLSHHGGRFGAGFGYIPNAKNNIFYSKEIN